MPSPHEVINVFIGEAMPVRPEMIQICILIPCKNIPPVRVHAIKEALNVSDIGLPIGDGQPLTHAARQIHPRDRTRLVPHEDFTFVGATGFLGELGVKCEPSTLSISCK